MKRTIISAGLLLAATACSGGQNIDAHADKETLRKELAEREKGNTGGANYGEFGPPDAYENGSKHPFYGSENVWSRRQFSDRAASLYYKRRGQRQMLAILDGDPAEAVRLADIRLADNPADLESQYTKTVALTQLGDLDAAWAAMQMAVDAGLPLSRFQAGPRDLLAPLTQSDRFRQLVASKGQRILHGPMLGAVTDRSARIWVRLDREGPFEVHAVGGGQRYVSKGLVSKASDYTAEAALQGLTPGTEYHYNVLVGGEVQDTGLDQVFRTAPLPGKAGRFAFGFGGCAGYTPEHEHMWDTIDSHKLDAFLFMGDNVYIDLPEAPNALHDYTYYRRQSREEYRRMVSSTPVYAIWDDHDAAYDDIWLGPFMDRPAWKIPMVEHFAQNWVNPNNGNAEAPGTWFSFSHGDVDFFMLDGRTWRTNPFDKGATMLGPVQKTWLKQALSESKATFKIIGSPVGWADGVKPGSVDTWAGFPEEREEIFRFIEAAGIDGVILLSSDRHRSEAWKITRESGYDFYEFNSGQLTNIHTHNPEVGSLFVYNLKDSFGKISVDTTLADPKLTYQIYNIDNELIETLVVRKSELTMNGEGF